MRSRKRHAGAASMLVLLILMLPLLSSGQDSLQHPVFAEMQLGLMLSEQPTNRGGEAISVSPVFHGIVGINWRPYLRLGIGSGYEAYGRIRLVPIFAQLGGELFQTKIRPYYSIRLGGLFAGLTDDFRYQHATGKWMLEGQLGLKIALSENVNWLVGAGYRRQKIILDGENDFWGNSAIEERIMQRVPVITGLRYLF